MTCVHICVWPFSLHAHFHFNYVIKVTPSCQCLLSQCHIVMAGLDGRFTFFSFVTPKLAMRVNKNVAAIIYKVSNVMKILTDVTTPPSKSRGGHDWIFNLIIIISGSSEKLRILYRFMSQLTLLLWIGHRTISKNHERSCTFDFWRKIKMQKRSFLPE